MRTYTRKGREKTLTGCVTVQRLTFDDPYAIVFTIKKAFPRKLDEKIGDPCPENPAGKSSENFLWWSSFSAVALIVNISEYYLQTYSGPFWRIFQGLFHSKESSQKPHRC